MATGTRSTNTMTEGLRRLLADLADMKILPDADISFILDIEQQIVTKLREPIDSLHQQGTTNATPPDQMPPGMDPSMMGAGPPPMGPGAGMGAPGPQDQQIPGLSQRRMPNPDELRRILSFKAG